MSQENVDVVVSALEKWNSGDDPGALEPLAPDVEVHHNIGRGSPLEGVYHGRVDAGIDDRGRDGLAPSETISALLGNLRG